MQEILTNKTKVIIRFDKNEDVLLSLQYYCKEKAISAGYFSAIGAASEVTIAYYDLPTKSYEDHTIRENVEIANLTGNIALFKNQLVIHAHGVFAKKDLSTIGGHLKKLIVSATCELTLTVIEGQLVREKNDEIGLNLLK